MEELILNNASGLFFSYGLKSVSMDDLARQTGVSKKTIYQFYTDKNELVNTIVDKLLLCHSGLFKKCEAIAKDPIDEVLKQVSESFPAWATINPAFFFELQRSFPAAWLKLEHHKQEFVRPGIIRNLEKGMQKSLYRAVDVPFTADIRLRQLQDALEPASFTRRRTNSGGLIHDFTMFYLHAITTDKGKRSLSNYLTKNNENRSGN
jgi:AcrR family transcriptional regulator